MIANSKELGTSAVVWSLVWAFATISTAFLFKGNPAESWIETVLNIGALAFVVLKRRWLVSPLDRFQYYNPLL